MLPATSAMTPPAWIAPTPVSASLAASSIARPAALTRPRARHAARPRAARAARIAMQGTPSTENLPLVAVSWDADLPTPGEHRQLNLDYSLLTSILQSQTTAFGLLPCDSDGAPAGTNDGVAADDGQAAVSASGALLTILRIDAVSHLSLSAAVHVHCPARLAVHAVQHASAADAAGLSRAQRADAVHDAPIVDFGERAALADAEWTLWERVRAASQLHRRLHARRRDGLADATGAEDATTGAALDGSGADADAPPSLAQRVFVWAPREYDRELTADDWSRTPGPNREVWMRRAESFSFAVVRAFSTGDDAVARARGLLSTRERVALGRDSVEAAIARMSAQMCVDEALRSE